MTCNAPDDLRDHCERCGVLFHAYHVTSLCPEDRMEDEDICVRCWNEFDEEVEGEEP